MGKKHNDDIDPFEEELEYFFKDLYSPNSIIWYSIKDKLGDKWPIHGDCYPQARKNHVMIVDDSGNSITIEYVANRNDALTLTINKDGHEESMQIKFLEWYNWNSNKTKIELENVALEQAGLSEVFTVSPETTCQMLFKSIIDSETKKIMEEIYEGFKANSKMKAGVGCDKYINEDWTIHCKNSRLVANILYISLKYKIKIDLLSSLFFIGRKKIGRKARVHPMTWDYLEKGSFLDLRAELGLNYTVTQIEDNSQRKEEFLELVRNKGLLFPWVAKY